MIENTHQLCVTLEQMRHMIAVLEGFRETVLKDGQLTVPALTAEGPIDMLDRMRLEALEFARQLPAFEVPQPIDAEHVESVS